MGKERTAQSKATCMSECWSGFRISKYCECKCWFGISFGPPAQLRGFFSWLRANSHSVSLTGRPLGYESTFWLRGCDWSQLYRGCPLHRFQPIVLESGEYQSPVVFNMQNPSQTLDWPPNRNMGLVASYIFWNPPASPQVGQKRDNSCPSGGQQVERCFRADAAQVVRQLSGPWKAPSGVRHSLKSKNWQLFGQHFR